MSNKVTPPYYWRNIARNAQRAYFRRKASEADREKRREGPEQAAQNGGKD